MLTFSIILFSCNNENDLLTDENENQFSLIENDEIAKSEFSNALFQAMSESSELRDVIKNEALRQIDYDYDVIYSLIKNKTLGNGKTVEELFSKYIDLDKLRQIEFNYPNLTIFVPSLPMDYFSAENWDTETQTPAVCYVSSKTNKEVPIIFSNGERGVIEEDLIPAFPIVIVKENERISEAALTKSSNSNLIITESGSLMKPLAFIDDVFNNINPTNDNSLMTTKNAGTSLIPANLQKVYDAYDHFNISGWQRDHVYYNLTPTKVEGPFDNKYMEHIVGFEMIGDGLAAIRKIADQDGDPRTIDKIKGGGRGRGNGNQPHWTDGEFEFKVKYYLGSKSPIGTEAFTNFRAKPTDLFDIRYEGVRKGNAIDVTWLYIKSATTKRIQLSRPLFEWNLENYSAVVKINIEEVDATQSVVNTTTTSSEFATNFEFNPTWGDKVKKGLKFGASMKETRTISYQVTTTYGNDELGEIIVNFSDPIITSKDDRIPPKSGSSGGGRPSYGGSTDPETKTIDPYYNTKYSTGWYRIYVAPLKIY